MLGVGLHLPPMLYLALALVGALPVQGDLKMVVEPVVYPSGESAAVLELAYEIPRTSLAFTREGESFVARYRVVAQVSDRRGNIAAGDVWEREVRAESYDGTIARDSVVEGAVRLTFGRGGVNGRAVFQDRMSERRGWASFRVEVPSGRLILRLLKSGKEFSARKYGAGDTLEAEASSVVPLESCRFAVMADGRVVTGATAGFNEQRVARFAYPIADSAGVARLGGGSYELGVWAQKGRERLTARAGFRVDVPFYLTDDAWREKVERLVHIASPSEMARLRAVPRAEREQAWQDFWKPKDQTPTTERNEREEEYFERIAYAEEHFGRGDRGYRSDRARVYVRYGQPDQVESRPFELDSPAYETWHYFRLNRRFVFVDRFGAGEMRLQNPGVLDD